MHWLVREEHGWLDAGTYMSMSEASASVRENADGRIYSISAGGLLKVERKGPKAAAREYRTVWRIYEQTPMASSPRRTHYVDADGNALGYREREDKALRHTVEFDTQDEATEWIKAEREQRLESYKASDDYQRRLDSAEKSGTRVHIPYEITSHKFEAAPVRVPVRRAAR
jgi:hypothetical protein